MLKWIWLWDENYCAGCFGRDVLVTNQTSIIKDVINTIIMWACLDRASEILKMYLTLRITKSSKMDEYFKPNCISVREANILLHYDTILNGKNIIKLLFYIHH